MQDKSISQAVISRLPRYYRYLGDLKDEGVERISVNSYEGDSQPDKTGLQ